MANPEHLRTPDQLLPLRERMQELHSQLEAQLPERLYAIFKAHPEVLAISWTQSSLQDGRSFSLDLDEIQLDTPDDYPAMADPYGSDPGTELEKEADRLLRSVHPEVLWRLWGNDVEVTLRGTVRMSAVHPFQSVPSGNPFWSEHPALRPRRSRASRELSAISHGRG